MFPIRGLEAAVRPSTELYCPVNYWSCKTHWLYNRKNASTNELVVAPSLVNKLDTYS